MADRPRVFVSRRFPGAGIERLTQVADVDVWDGVEPPTIDEFRERAAGCDALVTAITERVDTAVLDCAPGIRHVSNVAVGYDNIDVAACTERGVLVTNTPGVLTDATADLAMALILTVARRLPEAADAVRDETWGAWNPTWMCGLELAGATLGIVGYGAVGRAVADRARAFGMNVIHHSRDSSESVPLDRVFIESDVVSLHCPLTPETRGLVNAERLRSMRASSFLVNTARGGVVDSDALVHALREGWIAGAGLDVTDIEPLPHDHVLRSAPNCVILPHIGSATTKTRTRMADLALDQVCDVLAGRTPRHPVNPDSFAQLRS